MKEINNKINDLNQETNPKKEWIKPDLEIMEIEGGTPASAEFGSFFAST
jgi:hypothetical protein